MKRKEKIILYGSNFVTIMLAYSVYIFNRHYSEDSFEAMLNIGALANTNLRNGRFLHYFLYSFFDLIDFNILNYQTIMQMILTVVITIGISRLAICFMKAVECKDIVAITGDNIWKWVILDIGLLLMVINPCFLFGWYYWPETCIGASLSLAVTFIAIEAWCQMKPSVFSLVLSFVMLCLSISMYQIYVEIYVGICLVYCLVVHKYKFTKKSAIQSIVILLFGGGASILNIFLMSLIQKLGFVYKDERSATTALEVIVGNIKQVWSAQKGIWMSMDGLLPTGFLPILIIGLIVILVLIAIKQKKVCRFLDYLFILLCILAIWVLAFVPNLISGTVWLAPRTYIGIYGIVLLLVMWALQNICNQSIATKRIGQVLSGILSVALVVSMIQGIRLETDTVVVSRMDNHEVNTIASLIERYEAESGNYVDTIEYCYDHSRRWGYDEVGYIYDSNVRGMAYSWCFENMMKYYWREDISLQTMSQERYEELFGAADWDYFYPERQMYISENTAYLVIY